MKNYLFILILFMPCLLPAQHAASSVAAHQAAPADVSSMDQIIKTLYDAISGPAGEKRDSLRIASLFKEGAHVMPVFTTKSGEVRTVAFSIEEFYKSISQFTKEKGFFEQEIGRTTERFGNMAHVFSAYESRFAKTDEKPFQRGINSLQLMFDGQRWWVLNIAYEPESPAQAIPEKYLRRGE